MSDVGLHPTDNYMLDVSLFYQLETRGKNGSQKKQIVVNIGDFRGIVVGCIIE